MKLNANIKLTATQDKLLTKSAVGKLKADAALFAAIERVSEEHEVFKGLARGAIKEQAEVTLKSMDSRTFSSGLASLGKLEIEDELTKGKDGKEELVKDAKIADATLGMTSIKKGHKLFAKLCGLKNNMVDSLIKAKGVTRMTAHRWIDEVWSLRGLTLNQRELAVDDSRKASGLAVIANDEKIAEYHDIAKQAYEMVRDAVNPTTKKEWAALTKVLRQMEKEAVAASK